MSLKIYSVVNASKPLDEIVRLRTSEKINLKGYALVDRTFNSDGSVSNEFRHIYVFPDLVLNPNEWVRVHTGKGKDRVGKNDKDEVVHFLYWNADECVWNDKGGDIVTLIQYSIKSNLKVPPVKEAK